MGKHLKMCKPYSWQERDITVRRLLKFLLVDLSARKKPDVQYFKD